MDGKLDIYGYGRRIANVEKYLSVLDEHNRNLIISFKDFLFTKNLSIPRILKYVTNLKTFSELIKKTQFIKNKELDKLTKAELQHLVGIIQQKPYSPYTKHCYKIIIKKFICWVKNSEEGEVKAFLVRGVTPPDGIIVKTTVTYAGWASGEDYEKWNLNDEDASFDIHPNMVLYELGSRKRKAQFIRRYGINNVLWEIAIGHTSRSHMFKPEVSIVVPRNALYEDNELKLLFKEAERTGKDQNVQIHIISDGKKAYAKRV